MRIALFEPGTGGHRAVYLRRFVEALAPVADLAVAAPDQTLAHAGDLDAVVIPLGAPRPQLGGRLSRRRRSILASEVATFHRVARHADYAVHLFADNALRLLAASPRASARTSLLLFYLRSHYPHLYGSPLGPTDRALAHAKALTLARWRRRADAHAFWTLDEGAARDLAGRPGAPAHWLPEPPVKVPADLPRGPRDGCVLYGALLGYKGIDRLARAIASGPSALHVTLAGYADPSYRNELAQHVQTMRAAGARVDLHDRPHSESEGLAVLASAQCVVLPYHRHAGMSRVLVEAAAARTPVVVHRWGLMSHLVERHGIGRSVDADDPAALWAAIEYFCGNPTRTAEYEPALERFAARYSVESFRASVAAPFAGLRSKPLPEAARTPDRDRVVDSGSPSAPRRSGSGSA